MCPMPSLSASRLLLQKAFQTCFVRSSTLPILPTSRLPWLRLSDYQVNQFARAVAKQQQGLVYVAFFRPQERCQIGKSRLEVCGRIVADLIDLHSADREAAHKKGN